jgi:hypothetical protein
MGRYSGICREITSISYFVSGGTQAVGFFDGGRRRFRNNESEWRPLDGCLIPWVVHVLPLTTPNEFGVSVDKVFTWVVDCKMCRDAGICIWLIPILIGPIDGGEVLGRDCPTSRSLEQYEVRGRTHPIFRIRTMKRDFEFLACYHLAGNVHSPRPYNIRNETNSKDRKTPFG